MRLILLFCSVCLLVFISGCNRSGQYSTNNSAGTAEVSNGLNGDRSQARTLLGYTPTVALEDGLRQLVEWVRARDESPEQLLQGEVVRNWGLG